MYLSMLNVLILVKYLDKFQAMEGKQERYLHKNVFAGLPMLKKKNAKENN